MFRQNHSMRRSIPRHVLLTWNRALVVSKVDYCSSVLTDISGRPVYKLQSVLTTAARLVFSAQWSDHITPLLRELHWFRVSERAYRCLHDTAPHYLAKSLHLTRDVSPPAPVCGPPTVRCSWCHLLNDRLLAIALFGVSTQSMEQSSQFSQSGLLPSGQFSDANLRHCSFDCRLLDCFCLFLL